jgi:hypothetical protein
MKKELEKFINSELIVAKLLDGKLTTTVGTLVRLGKDNIQVKKETGIDSVKRKMNYIYEFIPYESVIKVSTGQKVLSR